MALEHIYGNYWVIYRKCDGVRIHRGTYDECLKIYSLNK